MPGSLLTTRLFWALCLAAGAGLAPLPAGAAEPLLQGPHPFARENDLAFTGGYGLANGFHGVHAGLGYGYQIAGSLWFELRLDLVEAGATPPMLSAPCTDCAEVDTFVDVMAGLSYRLRTDIPLVPYGGAVAGPLFLFHEGADGAMGLGLRLYAGARYFLYERLGLGLELGGTLGGALVDESAGLSGLVALLDLGISAELQF